MTLSEAEYLVDAIRFLPLLGGAGLLCLSLVIIIQLKLRDTISAWLNTFYMAFVVCFCTAVVCATIIRFAVPLQTPVQAQCLPPVTEAPE